MKTMISLRKLGQGILTGIVLTASTQINATAQSMASVAPKTILSTTSSGLEVAVYQVPETTKFKVHFVNNANRPVTLRIRDSKNTVIYTEKVTHKNYIRKFDLEKLGDGAYQFEISDGSQTITKGVDLQTVVARSVKVL